MPGVILRSPPLSLLAANVAVHWLQVTLNGLNPVLHSSVVRYPSPPGLPLAVQSCSARQGHHLERAERVATLWGSLYKGLP